VFLSITRQDIRSSGTDARSGDSAIFSTCKIRRAARWNKVSVPLGLDHHVDCANAKSPFIIMWNTERHALYGSCSLDV